MKLLTTSLALVFALTLAARADDVTAKISDVHICCKKCVKAASNTVASVTGTTSAIDQDAGTITITAPDKATAQKAADALVAAGFYGTSTDVTMDSSTGAKDTKVQKMEITGLHICCDKCTKAVNKTLSSVPGVTGNTAAKGVKSFTVSGDFNEKDVMNALQKAGLTGKVSE